MMDEEDIIDAILLDDRNDSLGLCSLQTTNPLHIVGDDWNERFQHAISLPESTDEEKLLKYTLLTSVNRDFIATAETYAKTVISEYFLPEHLKSVKSGQFGGIAGGRKYCWRGILFKLADGQCGPYEGSDAAAAKAMGHDLRGAAHLARAAAAAPRLGVALQALIDYRGFRMSAQALLPVDRSTLKAGSADACATPPRCPRALGCPGLAAALGGAARALGLKRHRVAGVELDAGCDVEGHLGRDGRFYLLDTARVFPPECPPAAPHLLPAHAGGFAPGARARLVRRRRRRRGDAGSPPPSGAAAMDGGPEGCGGGGEETGDNEKQQPIRVEVMAALGGKQYQVLLLEGEGAGTVVFAAEHDLEPGFMSIFWRMLRPEFVKDRGNPILEQRARHRKNTLALQGGSAAAAAPHPGSRAAAAGEAAVGPGLPSPPAATPAGLPARGPNGAFTWCPDSHAPAKPTVHDPGTSSPSTAPLEDEGLELLSPLDKLFLEADETSEGQAKTSAFNDQCSEGKMQHNSKSAAASPQQQSKKETPASTGIILNNDNNISQPLSTNGEQNEHTDTLSLEITFGTFGHEESTTSPPASKARQGANPEPSTPGRRRGGGGGGDWGASARALPSFPGAPAAPTPPTPAPCPAGAADPAPGSAAAAAAAAAAEDEGEGEEAAPPPPPRGAPPPLRHQDSKWGRYEYGPAGPAYYAFGGDYLYYGEGGGGRDPRLPPPLALDRLLTNATASVGPLDRPLDPGTKLDAPPLSSDAFSSFTVGETSQNEDNRDVYVATRVLVELVVPALAEDLAGMDPAAVRALCLADHLHSHGLNLRHLGLLRARLRPHARAGSAGAAAAAKGLLLEALARATKRLYKEAARRQSRGGRRRRRRQQTRGGGGAEDDDNVGGGGGGGGGGPRVAAAGTEEGLRQLGARTLNLLTGAHPAAAAFWEGGLAREVARAYGDLALQGGEWAPAAAGGGGGGGRGGGGALAAAAWEEPGFLRQLLERVMTMLGIELADETLEQLGAAPTPRGFELLPGDVERTRPTVKHLHLADLGEGAALSLLAQQREKAQSDDSDRVASRLGALACRRLQSALRAAPGDARTRHLLADAYQARAFATRASDPAEGRRCYAAYRRLREGDANTRCNVSGVGHREAILGVVVRVEHRGRSLRAVQKEIAEVAVLPHHRAVFGGPTGAGAPTPGALYRHPHAAAAGEEEDLGVAVVHEDTISLAMFLKGYGEQNRVVRERMEKACKWHNITDPYKLNANVVKNLTPYRFLPLIVDEEHGDRVLKLLEEEISRMKTQSYVTYECPVDEHAYLNLPSEFKLKPHPLNMVFEPLHALDFLACTMNSLVMKLVGGRTVSKPVASSSRFQTVKEDKQDTVKEGDSEDSKLETAPEASKPDGQGTNQTRVNEEALLLYCRLHHALLFLAKKHPEIQREATARVFTFAGDPQRRTKRHTPNLGELLIHLLVADGPGWADAALRRAFVAEVLDRNVSWFVANERKYPELLYLEQEPVAHHRLFETFAASITSMRIVMFQVYFLAGVGRRDGCPPGQMLHLYHSSCGRPTAAMREGLRRAWGEIMGAATFEDYFRVVGIWYGPRGFSAKLRNAVRRAIAKGYLRGLRPAALGLRPGLEPVPGEADKEGGQEEGAAAAAAAAAPAASEGGEETTWDQARLEYEQDKERHLEHARLRAEVITDHLRSWGATKRGGRGGGEGSRGGQRGGDNDRRSRQRSSQGGVQAAGRRGSVSQGGGEAGRRRIGRASEVSV